MLQPGLQINCSGDNLAPAVGFGAMNANNEDCPGLYPVIRNSLVGLAPYLGKFRALNQIGEFHCHSFFSELRPLPVVVQ